MLARLLALLLCCGLVQADPGNPTPEQYRQDFDALVAAIERDYAYLGSRATWRRAAAAARAKAVAAKSVAGFALAIDPLIETLRDDHVHVSGEGSAPSRRIPAETDLWAEWVGGKPLVTAVRASSVADVAGLHPGQEIVTVHGVPVDRVVRAKVGASGSGPERDWALRHVVAGPRAGSYFLGVREGGPTRQHEIVRSADANGANGPLLARKIGEGRDIAYLRLRNNLGDPSVVMHFDAALQQMKDTRGLILDLRSTESGGSDDVVRALLGRFVDKEAVWRVREARGRPRENDTVAPRGPFAYRAPLVVLVDRWTAGEGEALAAGLDAIAGATIVGTRMAGLRGARREVTLAHTGLKLSFPAERALHPNGTALEALAPDIAIDLVKPSGGPGDPILYAGLKAFDRRK